MRKIISQKLYDTNKATVIAQADGGRRNLSGDDFNYEWTDLYQTQSKAFFLAGVGGAKSRWAEKAADGWTSGGQGILPISEDEARDFVTDPDVYAEAFGEVEEA